MTKIWELTYEFKDREGSFVPGNIQSTDYRWLKEEAEKLRFKGCFNINIKAK